MIQLAEDSYFDDLLYVNSKWIRPGDLIVSMHFCQQSRGPVLRDFVSLVLSVTDTGTFEVLTPRGRIERAIQEQYKVVSKFRGDDDVL